MNGLDLTPWIERVSMVDRVIAVFVIFSYLFLFIGLILLNHINNVTVATATSLTSLVVAVLCCIGFVVTVIYRGVEFSDGKLSAYVANSYGLATHNCNLPGDAHDGVYECHCLVDDPDMSTYNSARRTETTMKVIIRDNRAYLYDENGKLMEVKQ